MIGLYYLVCRIGCMPRRFGAGRAGQGWTGLDRVGLDWIVLGGMFSLGRSRWITLRSYWGPMSKT
jgi:hypothetical protein